MKSLNIHISKRSSTSHLLFLLLGTYLLNLGNNILLYSVFSLYMLFVSLSFWYSIRIDKAVFLFLLLSVASLFLSITLNGITIPSIPSVIWYNIVLLVANILLYSLTTSAIDFEKTAKILVALSYLYIGKIVFDILQMITELKVVRYSGTFSDPNYFSMICLVFISVLAYWNNHTKKEAAGRIFIILNRSLIVAYSVALLLTFSRSGIIGWLIFIISVLVGKVSKGRHRVLEIKVRPILRVLAIIYAISLLVVFFLSKTKMFQMILSYFNLRMFGESDVRSGLSRLYEIAAGLNFYSERFPLSIIGMGHSMSEDGSLFREYYKTQIVSFYPRIHNTLAAILFEDGLGSFLVFFYIIYRNFDLLLTAKHEDKYIFLGLYLGILLISMFVWSLYFIPFFIAVFWFPVLISKSDLNSGRKLY